jgi:hypothetical protein
LSAGANDDWHSVSNPGQMSIKYHDAISELIYKERGQTAHFYCSKVYTRFACARICIFIPSIPSEFVYCLSIAPAAMVLLRYSLYHNKVVCHTS